MSPIIRIAALAIAATLALAACDGGDEAAATPVSDLTPSVEASALAELSARVDQLEAQLGDVEAQPGDDAEAQLGDDAEARLVDVEALLVDVEAQLDDVETRLGDVDPINLRSRFSELEEEVRLLSLAFEEIQSPTNLSGGSPEATD